MQETPKNLEKAVHKTNHLAAQYILNISMNKIKIMAFKGNHPIIQNITVIKY